MSEQRAALTQGGRALRVLFLVNEDWMFWSHRLALARAARDQGADVTVVTRVSRHGDLLRAEGFLVHDLRWRRGGGNVFGEIGALLQLIRLYRSVGPDIVHHVGIKSALYGGLACFVSRVPRQVVTLAGFGYVATSAQLRARVIGGIYRAAFRFLIDRRGTTVVVQNPDDAAELVARRMCAQSRIVMVRGSGVDTEQYSPSPERNETCVFVLAGRLVRSKGVYDAVEAARMLRQRGAPARLRLVGSPDAENPETVSREELEAWVSEGLLDWVPWTDDMPSVWQNAGAAVLPSYREGLPRTLLEAASCGRALVATDVPGCREIVRDGANGLLVPVKDPAALADAMERLARDAGRRHAMGAASRERVMSEFSDRIVVGAMIDVYQRAMGEL